MKKLGLFLSAVLAIASVSCASSSKEAQANAEEQAEITEIVDEILPVEGSWRLVDYVAADGTVTEVPQDANYILQFNGEDHIFGINTDCNSVGGQYKTVGDSITFDKIANTLMLCPEEKVENAMKAMFPRIDTYAINPDSVLRLRSDMRIMATFVKVTEEATEEAGQE